MRQYTEARPVYWGFLYNPLYLFVPRREISLYSEGVVYLLAAPVVSGHHGQQVVGQKACGVQYGPTLSAGKST